MTKKRIVVVGAGVAGCLIASGASQLRGVEVVCLERVGRDDHSEAGTGLNIGPNAIKALRAHMPVQAQSLIADSLPWRRWTIALADGRVLMDLDLARVADNDGIRIRWARLYDLLRGELGDRILYDSELIGAERGSDGLTVTWRDHATDQISRIDGVDLLIGADGRYSQVRQSFFGPDQPNFLGVCLYRLLFPAGVDCPIDDYGQWFNGPNRLLAFRVPGDLVYCAGSFPIPADAEVPAEMKSPQALRQAYLPLNGTPPCPEVRYLVDAIDRNFPHIHWARLQEGHALFGGEDGVLLVGDSAHPMVPTLGQGATQAIEDACVVVDELRAAHASGAAFGMVPARVEARRSERIRFVMDFSRDATDTMLAGADPVAGTAKKCEPEFRIRLETLYRDVPLPS